MELDNGPPGQIHVRFLAFNYTLWFTTHNSHSAAYAPHFSGCFYCPREVQHRRACPGAVTDRCLSQCPLRDHHRTVVVPDAFRRHVACPTFTFAHESHSTGRFLTPDLSAQSPLTFHSIGHANAEFAYCLLKNRTNPPSNSEAPNVLTAGGTSALLPAPLLLSLCPLSLEHLLFRTKPHLGSDFPASELDGFSSRNFLFFSRINEKGGPSLPTKPTLWCYTGFPF